MKKKILILQLSYISILVAIIGFYLVEIKPAEDEFSCKQQAANQVLAANSENAYELFNQSIKSCLGN